MFLLYRCILLNLLIFTYILAVLGNNNFLVKEWKCANRQCTAPISNAEASQTYNYPDHELKLKFNNRDKLSVLRKPFDDKGEYWWIRLEDSNEELEGYVHKNFIKETKVFTNNNALIKVSENELNQNSSSISPTSPKEIVVDGTTIYDFDGEPSSVDNQPSDNVNSLPNDSDIANNTDSDQDDFKVEDEDEDDSPVLGEPEPQYEKAPVINSEETVKASDIDSSTAKIDPEIRNDSQAKEVNSTSSSETEPLVSVNSDNVVKEPVSTSSSSIPQENKDQTILDDKSVEDLQNNDKVNENIVQDSILSSTESSLSSSVDLNQTDNKVDISSNSESSPSPLDLQNNDKVNENIVQNSIFSFTESSLSSSVDLNQTDNKVDISSSSESSPSPLDSSSNEINSTETNENKKQPDFQQFIANVSDESIKESQFSNAETNALPPDIYTNEIQKINKGESEKSSSEELPSISTDANYTSNIVESEDSFTTSIPEESKVEDAFIEKQVEQSATDANFSENNIQPPKQNLNDETNNIFTEYISVEKKDHLDSVNTDVPKYEADDTVTTQATPVDVHQNEEEKPNDIPNETSTETLVQQPSPDESILTTTEMPNYYKSDVVDPVEVENRESSPPEDNEITEEPKATEQDLIKENFEDSSQNWFSSVYSFMNSAKELYLSTLGTKTSDSNIAGEEIVDTHKNISPEQCDEQSSGEYCIKKDVDESLTSSLQDSESKPDSVLPELNSNFDDNNSNNWPSFKSLFWIIISSHVILCFSLGYYYLDNWKRDCELVQKNNILAGDLFVLEREKTILEEEFTVLKEDMQKILEEKTAIDNEIDSIKEELRKTKEEKQNAEEKELKSVKKLKMIEQNYNELRKVFSESKQKGDRSALISDIKKLKESIAEYNIEISTLKEELQEKKNEIKQLNINLQKSNEARMALQERFDKLVIEGQEVAKGYQETLSKMEQTIEENKNVQTSLEKDLRKHKKKCESLEIEKELAESALQKAHGITSAESLADWLEVKQVRSSLLAAEKEISKLSAERDSLVQRLDSIEEKCKSLTSEVIQLTGKYENAEKEKIDALTKLEVLSDHFEAKEKKIQEEYAMKEVEWLKKQSDENAIFQQLLELREENTSLKNMVESLKKEIVDQEASYKKIINTTEQKAHENWVTFRRTEIRLKEVQAEAAQLRNRLASLEVGDENSEEKLNKVGLEVNGDLPPIGSAMSPPFMLHPNEFIPPPPLVQLPPGANPTSRPPPLGRISSPPLVSGDFIPPPPLLPPYDVYSHVHQNPPSPSHIPPPLLHKPQPREHPHHHHQHHMGQSSQMSPPRKQKDSQSSNQSSDSPHDKTPARRNKR